MQPQCTNSYPPEDQFQKDLINMNPKEFLNVVYFSKEIPSNVTSEFHGMCTNEGSIAMNHQPSDIRPTEGQPVVIHQSYRGIVIQPHEVSPTSFHALPSSAISCRPNTVAIQEKLVANGIITHRNIDGRREQVGQVEETPPDFSKPETLTVKRPELIRALHNDKECSSCGKKFTHAETEKYREHLDWHFRENRRKKNSRKGWNCSSSEEKAPKRIAFDSSIKTTEGEITDWSSWKKQN